MSNLDSVVSAAIEDSAIVLGLSFSLSSQKGTSFVRAELVNFLCLWVKYLLSQRWAAHIEVPCE